VVALGGVVVDDVEDHLDAGRVQRLDHRLELLHLLAAVAVAGVGVLRGETRSCCSPSSSTALLRLAAVMAKHGARSVADALQVHDEVNLDAVKELGFLLFHEAEKKRDTKDAILFNGLVSAWVT
jgi:hypothetical protein